MKRNLLIAIFLLTTLHCYSQTGKTVDLEVKTTANVKERTLMLNELRAVLYKEWKLEFVFVVSYFKANNEYAWLEATPQRKDGKEMVFPEDSYDCCHVECLYKKQNGKWTILREGDFSTDLWYDGLEKQYPGAAKLIFPNGRDSR